MPLNNSYAITRNLGTLVDSTAGGTGTPVFVADAPYGIESTHSLKLNGYSSPLPRYGYNNFPVQTQTSGTSGVGRTATFWFKMVPTTSMVSGTSSVGASYIELWNNTSNQNSGTDFARINYGTYNSTGAGGADRFLQWNNSEVTVSTSIMGGTSIFTNRKVEFNQWYHIAFVIKDYSPSTLEKAIYVNGQCWHYSITSNKQTAGSYFANSAYNTRLDYMFTTETTATTVDKYLAHYAKWNRALTKEEIRAQAWYGHTNENYNTLILSDNPTYFAQLDNPDKATNNSVYGATSWGSLVDDTANFSVNQQGPANLKSWLMNVTTGVNYTRTTNTSMMSGLNSLITSGEFSVEFWYKSTKPSGNRDLITFNSGNSLNGYLNFRLDNQGRTQMNGSYKSSATSAVSGSMLGTGISTITTETTLNMHPGTGANNFADNEWHHFVYTFSKSDSWTLTGSYTGLLYTDGCKVDTRTWTNTYGWLDGTSPIDWVQLGTTSTTLTNANSNIAAIAIYPRRLTEIEIGEHFIAGKDYISEYGAVKYYDGTAWKTASAAKVWNGSAWINWVDKYYDGTQWVNL